MNRPSLDSRISQTNDGSQVQGLFDNSLAMSAEEDEEARFELEMKSIEELEKWEKCITEIPETLQNLYLETMKEYSTMRKISVYKLLSLFEWNAKICEDMHKLLRLVPFEKVDWLVTMMNNYHREGKLQFTFVFFSRFDERVLLEIFYELSDELLAKAINVGRFLEPEDLDLFVNFINELGVREVLQTIDDCDEPMSKHCRLCRTRRIFNLENRLINDQVPKGMIRVPGALAIYDKAEIWSRADEMSFSFDHAQGLIFWNKTPVDMMRICSKCLNDALRAATTDCTDVAIHHILAEERKPMLLELRRREQVVSELVVNIAKERVRRRTREFALKSLDAQRRGLRLEREAAEAKALAALMEAKRLEKEANYRATMKAAMAVDEKWVAETLKAENKILSKTVHLASMNYHPGFTRELPAPATRESAHSWRHAHYFPDGTPVSPEGAKQRYGTLEIPPDDRLDLLQDWKGQMVQGHAQHTKRIADFEAKKREAELKEFADHKEYVDKRLKRLKRKEENVARILEIEEQARVDRRRADKLARFLLRVAKMEANERFVMEIEDDLSFKRRFYEFECWREDVEREALWYEEMEQCSVDRFWGLDLEASLRQAEREKWIAWYDARVQQTREKLIYSKQIRPFVIEAKMKLYKHPKTGEVLK